MSTKNDTITFKEIFGPVHDEHVLPELDSCDLCLELHFHNATGELQVAKTNILAVTGEHLLVEQPKTLDKELMFTEGMAVVGFMDVFGSTYTFKSEIAGINSIVRLNSDKKRTLGMIITCPKSLIEGEKREAKRLSMARSQAVVSEFHEMVGGRWATSTPIDVKCFKGQILNFSRGGIAVRVESDVLADLPDGACFTFEFDLPGQDNPAWFAVELRYAQQLPQPGAMVFGFKFLQLPNRRVFRQTLRPYVRQIYKMNNAA